MLSRKIAVVGLGYVGLPVAIGMADRHETVGFDINAKRITELKDGIDRNRESKPEELKKPKLHFTSNPVDLAQSDFFIVAVPTPVDEAHVPDLLLVKKASETVARVLKKGDIIVYESTVYPGATEEECIPVLEKVSGLKAGKDFKIGYSPERINPGDTEHTFTKIKKVVAAQDQESLEIVSQVYASVITAGVHRAPTIKVAEAAKVIENTQRDLNIALMNELALIFKHLGVDTHDVLEAAGTKWNFLKFTPGLVGGHCIGVDPYYLTYRAEKGGYIPQVILAGRAINDGMGKFIAGETVKEIVKQGLSLRGLKVTVLGLTFKENISDIRNSKVVDIVRELESYSLDVQVHDPVAYAEEAHEEYRIRLTPWEELKPASAVVLAVSHEQYSRFVADPSALSPILKKNGVIFDVKSMLNREKTAEAGYTLRRL